MVSAQRLDALTLPHTGAFLHAVPSSSKFRLLDQELKIAIRIRLGIEFNIPPNTTCVCGAPATTLHMQLCSTSAPHTSRHDTVRDAFYDAAEWARLSPVKEPVLNTGQRTDLSIQIDNGIKHFDFTIVNPCQQRHLDSQASATKVLEIAISDKMNNYKDAIPSLPPGAIVAVPFLSSGGFSSQADDTLKKIVHAGPLYPHTDSNPFTETPHLYYQHMIAVAIQRENARAIQSRLQRAGLDSALRV
jgi:hypothetical protein